MSTATKIGQAIATSQSRTLTPARNPVAVGHSFLDTQSSSASGYAELRIFAELFEDAQKVRMAATNRVERGGLSEHPHVEAYLKMVKAAENRIGLDMRKLYKRVVDPAIVDWQEETAGIGDKALARLLGIIGHPIHTTRYRWIGEGEKRELVVVGEFDRRVSDLWSYCGHGDPTRKRKKGMDVEDAMAMGSPRAKMLVYLIAKNCVMADGKPDKNGKERVRSPYRDVYDDARMNYATREGWTPMHQMNAAIRKVGKEVLRDLWIVAS